MRSLHWFRSDLRLHDNSALHAAAAGGELLCLYIATPQQWQQHDDAAVKLDFCRRNLAVIEGELAALGIPLLYAQVPGYADIPALLEQLLPALQVSRLHCNAEYPLNERRRDESVQALCQRLAISMTLHDDQCLTAPSTVQNKSGLPFKVFTPWSKAVRARLSPAGFVLLRAPSRSNHKLLRAASLPAALCSLDKLAWPDKQSAAEPHWPAGEGPAGQRLEDFVEHRITSYKKQRDLPAVDGTSALSPWLAAGVLSVRQCWQATLSCEPGEGVFAWQNELLWRDFYKQVMWHYPRVSMGYNFREDLGHVPWRHDREDFDRWCEGRTGVPIVDAAMRQLSATGWMHNRLRMLTAMFLSKHLLIDWRWGERWFMQHLVDGDFSANNGGWQWSSSTGTDAVPYFRIFNPLTQSRRFDPEGEFLRRWLPELQKLDAKSIHDPGLLRPPAYPAPMLDLAFGRERALNAFARTLR